jgi:NAD(P)-dependent dehydrogenase (short-subunit alcohol dehydrogenase family)
MSRVFVSGSADGLGKMAAQLLIDQGVKLFCTPANKDQTQDVLASVRRAEMVAVGDVASISQTRYVAEQINHLPKFRFAPEWRHKH